MQFWKNVLICWCLSVNDLFHSFCLKKKKFCNCTCVGWTVVVVVFQILASWLDADFSIFSFRGHLKSPWSRRKRKHVLTPRQWRRLFTPDGKLHDEVKFLKKVRSGVSNILVSVFVCYAIVTYISLIFPLLFLHLLCYAIIKQIFTHIFLYRV